MKKKWRVIPFLLVLIIIGVTATTLIWRPVWEHLRPLPKIAVVDAMRTEAIDALVAKLP